jgi:hypothetical protein
MATLHLENVPEALVNELEEEAARLGKDINTQAAEFLRLGIEAAHRNHKWVEERLAAARATRTSMPDAWITEEQIRAARDEGRP